MFMRISHYFGGFCLNYVQSFCVGSVYQLSKIYCSILLFAFRRLLTIMVLGGLFLVILSFILVLYKISNPRPCRFFSAGE